jgi:hypothetical protein
MFFGSFFLSEMIKRGSRKQIGFIYYLFCLYHPFNAPIFKSENNLKISYISIDAISLVVFPTSGSIFSLRIFRDIFWKTESFIRGIIDFILQVKLSTFLVLIFEL